MSVRTRGRRVPAVSFRARWLGPAGLGRVGLGALWMGALWMGAPWMGALWMGAVGLGAAGGCQRSDPSESSPLRNGPLPAYRVIAEAYNARLAGLERLSTYTSVRFWYTDEKGKERTEVLDAKLQVVLPARMSLRMDKVSTTVAILGCDEDRYWWMELGDAPRAMVGSHAKATPERLGEIGGAGGVPVHPLDMIELLGITPLPMGEPVQGAGLETTVEWSSDGRAIGLTVPGRSGRRRIWVDPTDFRPLKIELLAMGGDGTPEVAAWSELGRAIGVEVRLARVQPRIPGEIVIHAPRARVRLVLSSPETPRTGPRPEVFSLERLLSNYRIREVRSLDETVGQAGTP